MPKIRLDSGIEYEAAPEVIAQIEKMRTDSAAVATQINAKDTEIATLKTAKDTLQARVDGLPAELEKARTDAAAAIANRAKLEDVAKTFKVDAKDKSDDEIKHAVIKTFNKDFDPKDKSADYVQAAFDFAVSNRKDDAMESQRRTINGGGGQRTDATDSRAAYTASLGSNATKKE